MTYYWFFFSYARNDSKSDPYLKKFYKELNEEVRRKTGDDAEFIGFFDRDDIDPATEWSKELSEALQQSRAFVFLLSPTYVRKDYCGREWQIFRERLNEYLKGRSPAPKLPPLMFPVLWVAEADLKGKVPPIISTLHYDHTSFGTDYVSKGLQQLRKNLGKYRTPYNNFLNSLAGLIKSHAEAHQVPALPTIQDIEKVESAWKIQLQAEQAAAEIDRASEARAVLPGVGPRCVDVVFLVGSADELREAGRTDLKYHGAGGGENWRPFLPESAADVNDIVQGVVSDEKMYATIVPFEDSDSLLRRLEDAESKNRLVIMAVDLWSVGHPRYQGFWGEFTARRYRNAVTLFVYGKTDDETSGNMQTLMGAGLEEFISRARADGSFGIVETVTSEGDLEARLRSLLSRMQMKVVTESDDALKAEGGQPVTMSVIEGPSASTI